MFHSFGLANVMYKQVERWGIVADSEPHLAPAEWLPNCLPIKFEKFEKIEKNVHGSTKKI